MINFVDITLRQWENDRRTERQRQREYKERQQERQRKADLQNEKTRLYLQDLATRIITRMIEDFGERELIGDEVAFITRVSRPYSLTIMQGILLNKRVHALWLIQYRRNDDEGGLFLSDDGRLCLWDYYDTSRSSSSWAAHYMSYLTRPGPYAPRSPTLGTLKRFFLARSCTHIARAVLLDAAMNDNTRFNNDVLKLVSRFSDIPTFIAQSKAQLGIVDEVPTVSAPTKKRRLWHKK